MLSANASQDITAQQEQAAWMTLCYVQLELIVLSAAMLQSFAVPAAIRTR
jgi:hypothetical protein